MARTRAYTSFVPRALAAWPDDTEPWKVVEGALVFADVSGFTALSERLAKRGKQGAEQLTELFDDVFEDLVVVVEDLGGDVLCFGGDALFVLFDQADASPRAAATATALQQALRRMNKARGRVAGVSLGMSIGAHAGTLQLLRVGTRYTQIAAVGSAVTRVLRLEAAASKGQVLISEELARAVDPRALGEPGEGGVLLRTTGALSPFSQARAGPRRAVEEHFIAPELRPHLRAGARPEHRPVTICFCKLEGTDTLVAEHPPREVHAVVDNAISRAQAISAEYGVCLFDVDVTPDGIKLLFAAGAPDAAPDAEDRMIAAARVLVAIDTPLLVRAGVNDGRAFVGPLGARRRRAYTLMGHCVNLTARLMSHSEPTRVLAMASTLEAARTPFDCEPRPPLHVKGEPRALVTAYVGEPHTASAERTSPDLPLVGRAKELRLLQSAWESLGESKIHVVDIVGPPGIGKSRLLAELRTVIPAESTVVVEAGISIAGRPYGALVPTLERLAGLPANGSSVDRATAFRSFVAQCDSTLVPWAPLLANPFAVDLPSTEQTSALAAEYQRSRLAELFVELLHSARRGPTLFLVEDVHWLDDSSRELLEAVARASHARPWLVVSTRRAEGREMLPPDQGDSICIELEPLAADDARALADVVLADAPLPVQTIAAAIERSEGNPLFLFELLRTDSAGGDGTLPATVESLLAASIDGLAPDDRFLLRQSAVLGVAFPKRLLVDATGAAPTPRRLRALRRFLHEDGELLRFRHALVRDAAYEALPYRERANLHLRAATMIERLQLADGSDEPERLSFHFFHAREFEKSFAYSRQAADRAVQRLAPLEASIFLQRALDALRRIGNHTDQRVPLEEALAEVEERVGHYGRARAALRRALRLTDDPGDRARLLQKDGWLEQRVGHLPHSLALYTRALRALDGMHDADSAAMRAELVVARAGIKQRQGKFRESVTLLEGQLDTLRTAGRTSALARAHMLLDSALSDLGEARGHEHASLATALYRSIGDRYGEMLVANNLGVETYFEGDWEAAAAVYEQSAQRATEIGAIVEYAISVNNIGEILSDQGRLDEALERFHDARRVWRGAGYAVGIALATSNIARAHVRGGDTAPAFAMLDDALGAFRGIGASAYALETQGRIVEALLVDKQSEEAVDVVERTIAAADVVGERAVLAAWLERLAGCAWFRLGESGIARTRLEASLDAAEKGGVDYERASTLEALAALDGEVSPQAAAIYERLGVRATPTLALLGIDR